METIVVTGKRMEDYIRDPIVYQRGDDKVFQPLNAKESWRQGLEAKFKYGLDRTWLSGVLLDVNIIVQESRVIDEDIPAIGDEGKEMTYTPEVKINGIDQHGLNWYNRSISITLQGAYYDSESFRGKSQAFKIGRYGLSRRRGNHRKK